VSTSSCNGRPLEPDRLTGPTAVSLGQALVSADSAMHAIVPWGSGKWRWRGDQAVIAADGRSRCGAEGERNNGARGCVELGSIQTLLFGLRARRRGLPVKRRSRQAPKGRSSLSQVVQNYEIDVRFEDF